MSTRRDRVSHLLKEAVSEIIQRELKDPRLGFITVTDAEISADLRHAKVFVSVMGSVEQRADSLGVLRNAEHFVRQTLGKHWTMKVLPEISFVLDNSVDHGIRILELLEQIKQDEQGKPS
jgi:ribosome-binding factor A